MFMKSSEVTQVNNQVLTMIAKFFIFVLLCVSYVLGLNYNHPGLQIQHAFNKKTKNIEEMKHQLSLLLYNPKEPLSFLEHNQNTKASLSDFGIEFQLGLEEEFSLLNPRHSEYAKTLSEIFLNITLQDLIKVAPAVRDKLNSGLFNHAFRVALEHRNDTRDIELPSIAVTFPDMFFPNSIMDKARSKAIFRELNDKDILEIPYEFTATDVDPEHKVAYWREDLGINLHHWHYHLVYPASGPAEAVNKDRRGELFYYLHHQMISRFNIERVCNKLNPVEPLTDFRKPLSEGYFPKMNQAIASKVWAGRPANLSLSDVDRNLYKFTISDIESYEKNILDAIKNKAVRNTEGQIIPLDDKTGIEILANVVQAILSLSPNTNLYGNLHNYVHIAIAAMHDPDYRHLEPMGIMFNNAIALRDPLFHRIHSYINQFFNKFKDNLPPYTIDKLSFRGVTVTKASINSKSIPNTLNTYWTKSDLDLSRGIDFHLTTGSILARLTHLNHDEFSYTITANNANNRNVMGTVRIFIAPRFDENKRPLNFNDQRSLMLEMDKFRVTLKPGDNVINRRSNESAITIPFEATFRDLNVNRPNDSDVMAISQYAYSGCGWPQHMLVPKGTEEGYPMDLFVMISDYEQDKINQNEPHTPSYPTGTSFCGLKDLKYPDAQAMGYPFDRASNVSSINQFLTPNMLVQHIIVKFTDIIKPRQ